MGAIGEKFEEAGVSVVSRLLGPQLTAHGQVIVQAGALSKVSEYIHETWPPTPPKR
jgi:hypothetical protein